MLMKKLSLLILNGTNSHGQLCIHTVTLPYPWDVYYLMPYLVVVCVRL
jgi:hypothetical protein